jgi:hypothetical protein
VSILFGVCSVGIGRKGNGELLEIDFDAENEKMGAINLGNIQ